MTEPTVGSGRCPLRHVSRADITVTVWEHDDEQGHRHGIELEHAACGWNTSYTADYPLTVFDVFIEVERHLPPVEHHARRGSNVEAWLERIRDEYAEAQSYPPTMGNMYWHVVDGILDDYRNHADTGTPLDVEVQGPYPD